LTGLVDHNGKALRRPFSLAQTQMTWWFFIVLGCFVYAFAKLGTLDKIPDVPNTALWLMGIGVLTGGGAAMVERTKTNPILTAFDDVLKKISDRLAQGVSAAALAPFFQQRDELAKRLASTNFFVDILTDVDGISLHRFQAAVWTVILGVIFVAEVLHDPSGQMPTFNNNVLILLGISGGTYVGFKIPEQPN
jgi:hypothetical protein